MKDPIVHVVPGHAGPKCFLWMNGQVRRAPLRMFDRRLVGPGAYVAAPRQDSIMVLWDAAPLDYTAATRSTVPAKLAGGHRPAFGICPNGDVVQWTDPYMRGSVVFDHWPTNEAPLVIVNLGPADACATEAQQVAVDALIGTLRKGLPYLRNVHMDAGWKGPVAEVTVSEATQTAQADDGPVVESVLPEDYGVLRSTPRKKRR